MHGQHDEMPHPVQVDAWRRMGAEGRSQVAMMLRRRVRVWKVAALRERHPEWSEDHLQREVAAIYLRGNT